MGPRCRVDGKPAYFFLAAVFLAFFGAAFLTTFAFLTTEAVFTALFAFFAAFFLAAIFRLPEGVFEAAKLRLMRRRVNHSGQRSVLFV